MVTTNNAALLIHAAECYAGWVLILIVVSVAIPAVTRRLLLRADAVRSNYRGDKIPTMFGISVIVGALMLFSVAMNVMPRGRDIILRWITVIICFGLLGFIDDKWGDTAIKGLKGHIRAATTEFRITTGLIKAVGGLAVGLFVGIWLYPTMPIQAAVAGLVIALSANAMNLLDLRPGRASGVFLLLSAVVLTSAIRTRVPYAGELLLVCVLLPAIPAWLLDSRAKVMLGDTGSNVLGAALGLAITESHLTYLEWGWLMLLVGLHVVAERTSLSEIIAKHRLLTSMDRITGVRD